MCPLSTVYCAAVHRRSLQVRYAFDQTSRWRMDAQGERLHLFHWGSQMESRSLQESSPGVRGECGCFWTGFRLSSHATNNRSVLPRDSRKIRNGRDRDQHSPVRPHAWLSSGLRGDEGVQGKESDGCNSSQGQAVEQGLWGSYEWYCSLRHLGVGMGS